MMLNRKDKLARLIVDLPAVRENVPEEDLHKITDYKSLKNSNDPYIKTLVYGLEATVSNLKSTYDDFTKFINLL